MAKGYPLLAYSSIAYARFIRQKSTGESFYNYVFICASLTASQGRTEVLLRFIRTRFSGGKHWCILPRCFPYFLLDALLLSPFWVRLWHRLISPRSGSSIPPRVCHGRPTAA